METKEIANSLRCCVSSESCKSCGFLDNQQCRITMKIIAANRLEELEAELEKRTINDRPYEWISVEDEPVPRDRDITKYFFTDDMPCVILYYGNGEKQAPTHWMQLDPPKPKEPTFKDVFLKAFPQAVVLEHSGVPRVCAKEVFPQLGDDESPCDMCCAVCWSRPYFEPKEEG